MSTDDLHPLVRQAVRGELPPWSVVEPGRRAHLERVAGLLESWARDRDLPASDVARWTAAGWLHDALRDADPEVLRDLLEAPLRELPGPLLHGPAAAERLRREGLDDRELLAAVAYHTLGHPELGALGRATYCADFLEPGRTFLTEARAELRERMPEELDAVTTDVARIRIRRVLDTDRALYVPTVGFWNRLIGGPLRNGRAGRG